MLANWGNFFVIVGSSGGALTGLMFVVITLVVDSPMRQNPEGLTAFGTPNVIHFVMVLLISAILSAPWQNPRNPAHVVGFTAIAGISYVFVVGRRMLRQRAYEPVFEDWIFHLFLPFGSYAALFVGAAGLSHGQPWAVFVIGTVLLVLLCIGIHNAWDTVTYLATLRAREPEKKDERPTS